ncbi:hypothetical protein PVAP13_3KG484858 [Panicum virgatum]|uniref:Uncharacterized protein n=1 Tax=Panicum virgatum TaxID=38727 RepID=A0A8T0V0L5_PANVG|nr:hypothetical protein PVAP13_3KG484858 [Panicum virgatum]
MHNGVLKPSRSRHFCKNTLAAVGDGRAVVSRGDGEGSCSQTKPPMENPLYTSSLSSHGFYGSGVVARHLPPPADRAPRRPSGTLPRVAPAVPGRPQRRRRSRPAAHHRSRPSSPPQPAAHPHSRQSYPAAGGAPLHDRRSSTARGRRHSAEQPTESSPVLQLGAADGTPHADLVLLLSMLAGSQLANLLHGSLIPWCRPSIPPQRMLIGV